MVPIKQFTLVLLIAAAVGWIGIDEVHASGKHKLTKKDLPAAVSSVFETDYPSAVIRRVSKEIENGKACFEIESIDGKTKRDLLYDIDGTVLETEEEIAITDIPASVAKTLKADYRRYRIIKAEKVMHGQEVSYEMHLKGAKERKEVVFDASGSVLKTKKK